MSKRTKPQKNSKSSIPERRLILPLELRKRYRRGNDDALSNRAPEPDSPEYAYLHRYDSPDNERDSMG